MIYIYIYIYTRCLNLYFYIAVCLLCSLCIGGGPNLTPSILYQEMYPPLYLYVYIYIYYPSLSLYIYKGGPNLTSYGTCYCIQYVCACKLKEAQALGTNQYL